MTFTTDAVTEALHKIVAEKGADYVYPGARGTCMYSERDGSPSCIVGHVVAVLEPEAFEKIVEIEAAEGESTDARALLGGWGVDYDWETGDYRMKTPALVEYDNEVSNALELAQRAQDGGLTWGEAQEYFDRYISGGESFMDLAAEIRERTGQ